MNNIIRITKKNNIRVKNLHNGVLFPKQDILEIEFDNSSKRIIDLMSQKDITDINYLQVVENEKTKTTNLFYDNDYDLEVI